MWLSEVKDKVLDGLLGKSSQQEPMKDEIIKGIEKAFDTPLLNPSKDADVKASFDNPKTAGMVKDILRFPEKVKQLDKSKGIEI
ncbi:MAG: hypothetical protein ACRCUS_08450 [Anaerovoracaceae bacterium]